MPYKEISMSKIPPSLKRNKEFTYQNLNSMIKNSFEDAVLQREEKCTYEHGGSRIYLQTLNVKEIKSVQIVNQIGSEIKYSECLNTGSYQNYIELSRPLITGESIVINFIANPSRTDLLDDEKDSVFLQIEVYNKLIDKLYGYAKLDNI